MKAYVTVMGAHMHWQEGGGLSLWKCCKEFCALALAVTVKRSVN